MTTTRRGVFGLFAALVAIPAALASAALRIPVGNGIPYSEYIEGSAGTFEPAGPCVGEAMSFAPGRDPVLVRELAETLARASDIPVSHLMGFADAQAAHEQITKDEALERWRALFHNDPCTDLFLREPPIKHDTVQEI